MEPIGNLAPSLDGGAPVGADEGTPDASPLAPLTFSDDQQVALFGGPAEPGQEYTITIRAGEPGEDGALPFEVVQEQAPSGEAPEGEGEEPVEEEDSPELTQALGYDRGALMRDRRKMQAPDISAKSLKED